MCWLNFVLICFCWKVFLTPSLPQPVKCPGWMMHGRACKQCIFWSYNTCFRCCEFWCRSVHMPAKKRRQKALRVWNLELLRVVFKWNHGSEGVKFPVRYCICTHTKSTPSNLLLATGWRLHQSSCISTGSWITIPVSPLSYYYYQSRAWTWNRKP